jgi:hypothetical protein
MTWTTNPYCTRSDVKLMLDPNMGAQDDGFIDNLIIMAQANIDSEIGYAFQTDGTVNTPSTRSYDGGNATFLWIDGLITLTQVIEKVYFTYLNNNTLWVTGPTSTTDITADIILKPNDYASRGLPAHKLVRNSGLSFQSGTQNIVVSGVWGWPVTNDQIYPGIPNDIGRATARLAVHYFKMRDTAYADIVQSQGGIREKYDKGWPKDVMETIANYQRTRFYTHSYW